MVPEEMAHHEDALPLLGDLIQFGAVPLVQAEGFFHIDVLAGQKGFPRQGGMSGGRGGQDDSLDFIIR